MTETKLSIAELSVRVQDEAFKTAFALMKANYVERSAPEFPGGTIRGLEPHARDLAVRLRDSISARFNSLRFHHGLMATMRENERGRLTSRTDGDDRTQIILAGSWHAHFLFDDLVFNAASLCDYLGNAIWFGFHGGNYVKKKWNSTYDAAKSPDFEAKLPRGPRIYSSRTGKRVLDAHEALVNDLYGYRSDLIHHSIDGPDIYSHDFWEERAGSGSRLAVPRIFSKRLRHFMPNMENETQIDIVEGGNLLVTRLGHITLDVLISLRDDIGWMEGEPVTMLG